MSRQATTLLLTIALFRRQQAGVFLFRDYEQAARNAASELISQ